MNGAYLGPFGAPAQGNIVFRPCVFRGQSTSLRDIEYICLFSRIYCMYTCRKVVHAWRDSVDAWIGKVPMGTPLKTVFVFFARGGAVWVLPAMQGLKEGVAWPGCRGQEGSDPGVELMWFLEIAALTRVCMSVCLRRYRPECTTSNRSSAVRSHELRYPDCSPGSGKLRKLLGISS